MHSYTIGLMSGTSLDGVDGVLLQCAGGAMESALHRSEPLSAELRAELLALNSPGPNELHRAALAANALAEVYARVAHALLEHAGLSRSAVAAIGVHGQTVRHQPGAVDGTGYTLQLNNPALLAERTGIAVVCDFRVRDLAAGGQGAPLVPAFHAERFGRPGQTVLVLNLGGIANLSVLGADGSVAGFDCGPANVLMDLWCRQHTGQAFDEDGAWAASGHVQPSLLHALRDEAYFLQPPPKSTGRDRFHADWLAVRLAALPPMEPADVQATLAELTACTCVAAVETWGQGGAVLLLCGGGALNAHLVQRLQLGLPGVSIESTADHGLPPLQVEAAAFAWLAHKFLRRETGSLPAVTGARGPRVLGALYPA